MPAWDDSLVDPTDAPYDGLLLRAVGGRSGQVTLENGQKIRFPYKAQQEISGSVPPRVQAYEENAPGISHKLILLLDGAGFPGMDSYPQIELESTFADDASGLAGARGEPALVLYSGSLTGDETASITLQGGATNGSITLSGDVGVSSLFTLTAPTAVLSSITNPTGSNITISCTEDIAINTSGVGDNITISTLNGTIAVTPASTLTLGSTGGSTVITSGSGSLSLASTGGALSLSSSGGDLTLDAASTNVVKIAGVDVETPLGQWTAYTPTVTQSITVSKTVTYSRYMKLGRTVIFECYLAITSSGTANNAITITLPATAAQASLPVGWFYWYSSGSAANFINPAWLTSTTSLGGLIHGTAQQMGQTQAGWPNQLVSGDSILFFAIYEAAS